MGDWVADLVKKGAAAVGLTAAPGASPATVTKARVLAADAQAKVDAEARTAADAAAAKVAADKAMADAKAAISTVTGAATGIWSFFKKAIPTPQQVKAQQAVAAVRAAEEVKRKRSGEVSGTTIAVGVGVLIAALLGFSLLRKKK